MELNVCVVYDATSTDKPTKSKLCQVNAKLTTKIKAFGLLVFNGTSGTIRLHSAIEK